MGQAWVQHHPKFYGLKVDHDAYSDGSLMDDVMQVRHVSVFTTARRPCTHKLACLKLLYMCVCAIRSLPHLFQLMVKASQWESADPHVHAVLGVLYNASEDFDSAVAAFRTALAARPDDYTLWNKVGGWRASRRAKTEVAGFARPTRPGLRR